MASQRRSDFMISILFGIYLLTPSLTVAALLDPGQTLTTGLPIITEDQTITYGKVKITPNSPIVVDGTGSANGVELKIILTQQPDNFFIEAHQMPVIQLINNGHLTVQGGNYTSWIMARNLPENTGALDIRGGGKISLGTQGPLSPITISVEEGAGSAIYSQGSGTFSLSNTEIMVKEKNGVGLNVIDLSDCTLEKCRMTVNAGKAIVVDTGGRLKLFNQAIYVNDMKTSTMHGFHIKKDASIDVSFDTPHTPISMRGGKQSYGIYAEENAAAVFTGKKDESYRTHIFVEGDTAYNIYADSGNIAVSQMRLGVQGKDIVLVEAKGESDVTLHDVVAELLVTGNPEDHKAGALARVFDGAVLKFKNVDASALPDNVQGLYLESGRVQGPKALLGPGVRIKSAQESNTGIYSACSIQGEGPVNTVEMEDTSVTGFAKIIHVDAHSTLHLTVDNSSKLGEGKDQILCDVQDFGQAVIHASNESQLTGDLQGKGKIQLTLNQKASWIGKTAREHGLSDTSNRPDVTMILADQAKAFITGDTFFNTVKSEEGEIVIDYNAEVFPVKLQIHRYEGAGSKLTLNTDFSQVGEVADVIAIDEHTDVLTDVMIQSRTKPLVPFLSGSVPLIKVASSTADHKELFTSDQTVEGEGFQYLFRYLGTYDGHDQWGLNLPGSGMDNRSLYAQMPKAALNYGLFIADSLHERMGDQFASMQDEPALSPKIWTRLMYEKGEQKKKSASASQLNPKVSFYQEAAQLGMNLYQKKHVSGHHDLIGVYSSIGRVLSHVGKQGEIASGKDRLQVTSAGLYLTHYGLLGGYIDALIQGNYYEAKVINPQFLTQTTGFGLIGSLEGGIPFIEKKGFVLEPQIQLVSQGIYLHSFVDEHSKAKLTHLQSVVGRVGMRAAKQWKIGLKTASFWTRLSGYQEFMGHPHVTLKSGHYHNFFQADHRGGWVEFNLGISLPMTSLCELYGSSSYMTNLNSNHAYDGKLGLKLAW